MALDFSVLQGMDPAGAFFRGQEAVRAEADRNMLRQMQMEQMAAQRENVLAQRQQRLEEAEMRRRAIEAPNALATYAASGQPMTPAALARFGEPGIKLAETMRKQQADQLDQELKVLDYATRRLAAANPQNYPAIRADLARINPQFAAGLPEQFDPEQVMALARQGLSLKEQIESATKETVLAPGASLYRGGKLVATAPVKEPESKLLTPEEEAQRIRIARESRPPAQPREPGAPVAVVDEATGKVKFVSREEAVGKTPATAMEGLSPKEIQKREAAWPQATSAIKGFETKSDAFIRDLKALRDDPGLENITGPVFGRTPSVTAAGSRAQALYDKVVAKGGFQALQDLRDASKTGGALGNVSNQEGKQLTASFAAIDRRQNAADVRAAIDQAIADIEGSKTRMREAYDATYAYKQSGAATSAAPRVLSAEDQQALNWANANPKDPRAAQIKQRLGM